jgi:hypothetical protein
MSLKTSLRFALAFLFLFFCSAPILQSCSEGEDPFNDFSTHPDVPLGKFAAGRLGIVKPTFARSYLVVAYRYASGVPLTHDEQLAASALWNDRVSVYSSSQAWDEPYEKDGTTRPPNPYEHRPRDKDAPTIWTEARGQVASLSAKPIDQMQQAENYVTYLNCADDALITAANVLGERVKTFGKDHPGIKAWIEAQDLVFTNCSGGPANAFIPQQPDAALPEILRFDREYQIAAAYMYSQQFDRAEKGFQQIAAEKKSPWHEIAPYLVARNKVRRAELDVPKPASTQNGYTPHPDFDPEKLQSAETYIRSFLTSTPQDRYAPQFQALLDRVEYKLNPNQQMKTLSEMLRKPSPPERLYQRLLDYTWLLDLRADTRREYGNNGDPKQFADKTPERQTDELTDWLATFQMTDAVATEHALQMWHAHRDSAPWLLAALSKTEKESPFASEVLSAADRIPSNSPIYISAFYHCMRLRNAAHDYKTVRQSIDALLASKGDLPSVAEQDILDLRLDAASDLNDTIPLLSRGACDVERGDSSCMPVLAPHGATYLDTLPLDDLLAIFQNPKLSREVHNQIRRNVWMRAMLLGRHDVATTLDGLIQDPSIFPGNPTKESIAQWIKDYESAPSPEEKQFAAIFLLQHQYATGFNMGSTDAWCASPYTFEDGAGYKRPAPAALPDSPFLTEAQRKQAATERTALDNLDSQANYYTKTVLDFAVKHPDDPRVPEALSRAVKNTRMNCNNPRTGALSKKAYDLLHQRYASTSWAKNTKYWYD